MKRMRVMTMLALTLVSLCAIWGIVSDGPSVSAETDPPVYGSEGSPYGGMEAIYDGLTDGMTIYLAEGSPLSISFIGTDATDIEDTLDGTGLTVDYVDMRVHGIPVRDCTITIAEKTVHIVLVDGAGQNHPIYGLGEVEKGDFPDAYIMSRYDETISVEIDGYNSSLAIYNSNLESYGITLSLEKKSANPAKYDIILSGVPTRGVTDLEVKLKATVGAGMSGNSTIWSYKIDIIDYYTIIFDSNQGNISWKSGQTPTGVVGSPTGSTVTVQVPYGERIYIPDATRTGYLALTQWYSQPSNGIEIADSGTLWNPNSYFDISESPITVYAQWKTAILVSEIIYQGPTEVNVGDIVTLTATTDSNATDKTVYWDWTPKSIATINGQVNDENGSGNTAVFTAHSEGVVTITITSADNAKSITRTITIKPESTPVESYDFVLRFNANGGDVNSLPDDDYRSSNIPTMSIPLSIIEPTREGHLFMGWNVDKSATSGNKYPATQDVAADVPLTVYAIWKAIPQWTLSFDANGGSGAPADMTAYVSGSSYTFYPLPATVPTLAGKAFFGWAESDIDGAVACSQPEGHYKATSKNTTLYAVWGDIVEKKQFQVIYEDGPGHGGPGESAMIERAASKVEITISNVIPIREGWDFLGWSKVNGSSEVHYLAGIEYEFSGIEVVYAVWSQTSFILKLNWCDTSEQDQWTVRTVSELGAGSHTFELTQAMEPTREGYDFQGWSGTKGGAVQFETGQTVEVTGANNPLNLYAVWKGATSDPDAPATYDIRFFSNDGKETLLDTRTVSEEAGAWKYTLTENDIPVKEGWTFQGWADIVGGTSAVWTTGHEFDLTSDISLYAVFTQDTTTWTLTYYLNNGYGDFPQQSNPNVTGTSCVFKIHGGTPGINDGRMFRGWHVENDQTVSDDYIIKPGVEFTSYEPNEELYAIWEVPVEGQFKVFFYPNGGEEGSTPPDYKEVMGGLTVLQYPVPDVVPTRDGYNFLGWSTDDKATEAMYGIGDLIPVKGSIHLFAIWEKQSVSDTTDGGDWRSIVLIALVLVLIVFVIVRYLGVI